MNRISTRCRGTTITSTDCEFEEDPRGDGQLELDIDYILEWLRPSESTFAFRVAPAALTFIDVRTWTYT
jgi:hypothetical protein